MEERQRQLSELRAYIARVEKDVTLALQTLQWDRRHLLEDATAAAPTSGVVSEKSLLKAQGYNEYDMLLPDANPDYGTVVKLESTDISQIIKAAAENDPSFRMGRVDAAARPTPLTSDRLVATFTRDERRVIYDAVAARAPSVHTVQDLVLQGNDDKKTKPKSSLEIMAELRDMKRRRTKYKVATKSKNYSQVLRQVIANQMELYTGVKEKSEENNSDNRSTVPYTAAHSHNEIKQEHPSVTRDYCRREDSVSSGKYSDHKSRPSHSLLRDSLREKYNSGSGSLHDYKRPIKIEADSQRERSGHGHPRRERESRERRRRDTPERGDHRHRRHHAERTQEHHKYDDYQSTKREKRKSGTPYKSHREKR